MERVGWHGEIGGEDAQGGGAVNRDAGLVDLAGGVGDGGEVEAELRGEEAIDGGALRRAVVVAFVGQMDVGDFVGGAVVAVDSLEEGEFHAWSVRGPILAAGNQQLRARRGEGGDHGVVGKIVGAAVDGHAALAGAAAEEVRRDHHDGRAHGHARVEGGEEKCLRAATGFAGDRDARGIGAVEPEEKIEGAHPVPHVDRDGEGIAVRGEAVELDAFAVGKHVDGENDRAHAREIGAAGLHRG